MLAAALAAAACGPRPAQRPGGDFAGPPEKRLFAALTHVQAAEGQRAAIYAAFDETQPQLKALAEEAEAILREWHALDRRATDFVAQSERLATRYGEVARRRLALNAAYEGRIAAALDAGQWDAWQEFWNRPVMGPGPPGEGGRGPPPGGGRRR